MCSKYKTMKENRVGEKVMSNSGYEMEIIEYINYNNITIKTNDWNNTILYNKNYRNFKRGFIKNPYDKTVFSVGYVGVGDYKPMNEGKKSSVYTRWANMLKRCYCDDMVVRKRYQTYDNAYVCEEWYNFQNFAKWHEENYYEIDDEQMNLDKDILIKGNKVYSPETCVFTPHFINKLFVKNYTTRGDLPIGIKRGKGNKSFEAMCANNLTGRRVFLGTFYNIKDAFKAYKEYKEMHIKEVADLYKDKIPQKLYEAMYKHKVEIDD